MPDETDFLLLRAVERSNPFHFDGVIGPSHDMQKELLLVETI